MCLRGKHGCSVVSIAASQLQGLCFDPELSVRRSEFLCSPYAWGFAMSSLISSYLSQTCWQQEWLIASSVLTSVQLMSHSGYTPASYSRTGSGPGTIIRRMKWLLKLFSLETFTSAWWRRYRTWFPIWTVQNHERCGTQAGLLEVHCVKTNILFLGHLHKHWQLYICEIQDIY